MLKKHLNFKVKTVTQILKSQRLIKSLSSEKNARPTPALQIQVLIQDLHRLKNKQIKHIQESKQIINEKLDETGTGQKEDFGALAVIEFTF